MNMEVKQPICAPETEWYGKSNTMRFGLIYSLKNHKWIKGYINGTRSGGTIAYSLFPGRYVRCRLSYWNKEDPPFYIRCELIALKPVEENGKITCVEEEISAANARFYTRESGVNYFKSIGLEMIADLISWAPSYHGYPAVNFSKVYTQELTDNLVNWVLSKAYWVEGEENE